jgi:hypothetical protein
MPDLNGRDLLHEWRQLMDAVIASASSATGRRDLPGELLGSMQRQLELVQEVVDRERRLQGELAGRLMGPVDAVFDLLEQTGATLRQQAEALQTAGRALEESAGLMKSQAELFERAIAALREPAERARVAACLERRGGKARKRAPGS